jgi:hypothetical protein
MRPATDAWTEADPTVCPVCQRDGCEDHLPVDPRHQSALVGYTLSQLATHRFPRRNTLLCRSGEPFLRAGQLAEIYAERGFGKTWVLQTMAVVAATRATALGFSALEPCRVLHVDGEMAGEENQERFGIICDRLKVPFASDRLTIIAADWQTGFLPRVDTAEGQDLLEPFVEAADLIILDNRSCLFDPEGEKDPTAWQPAQNYLLSLRRRGKAVLVGHHSNRQGGARGHSKPEDQMDLLIKLARPDDYSQDQGARFTVSFEKSRGVHGSAVAPFEAWLTADGWRVDGVEGSGDFAKRRLAEYLTRAHAADDRPRSANAAIRTTGINRNKGLEVWAGMLKKGELVKHPSGGFYLNGHGLTR